MLGEEPRLWALCERHGRPFQRLAGAALLDRGMVSQPQAVQPRQVGTSRPADGVGVEVVSGGCQGVGQYVADVLGGGEPDKPAQGAKRRLEEEEEEEKKNGAQRQPFGGEEVAEGDDAVMELAA